MPSLEILTIGTELLLGEITDTNSTYIARTMRDHGIDIYRITTIGDNPVRIANTIKEGLQRADIIITTGGLGPTIDDPTRQAVADAVGRRLVFRDELWDQIEKRYQVYGRIPT
jgi:molybdenum cofactor synthesis domain-containing protein